jgi:KDO2-lipid IV(A) lauroyltransferase
LDYLVYLIYKAFTLLLRVLPKFFIKKLLDFFAFLAYLLDKKHYKIAKSNLDLAFGNDKTEKEKKDIIKSSLRNMAYNMYEFIVLQYESLDQTKKKISVENDEKLVNLLKDGKRIIIATGHYGCWELALPYFAMVYNPLTVISRKLNNLYLNQIFLKARKRQNLSMCEKKGAARCIVQAVKKQRIIVITIDQSINNKQSVDVCFFKHKASQVDSPVRLASKLDAVIMPIFSIRDDFGKYRLIFKDPIEIPPSLTEEDVVKYSQKLSDVLEEQIKTKPDDWFWQHRRWKLYYPEIYKK